MTNTAFSMYIFLKYLEHPGTRAISNAAALLNVAEIHSVVDPQLGPRESRAVTATWHVTIALSTEPCGVPVQTASVGSVRSCGPSYLLPSGKEDPVPPSCDLRCLVFSLDAQETSHLPTRQRLVTGDQQISYFCKTRNVFPAQRWLID